ncbi:hypothetical protein D3C87_1632550 [compost metagenome]
MTTDQFAGDAVDHPGKFETPFFPGQLAVIHHLEQQIAQLALQVIEVAALDGVGHFVGFFEGVRNDGRVGLLDVPRATVLRIAQTVHQVEQVFKAVHTKSHSTLSAILIVPTLCVGMQPVTLRVTGRRASLEAFPRGAWERSIEVIFKGYGYAAFR